MIEFIKIWVTGMTAAAVVVAVANCLTPEGTVKKIGKMVGGLIMMIAVLQPVLKLDLDDLSGILTKYRMEAEVSSSVLESENQRLMKIIIEDKTKTYILDRAGELGIKCNALVECSLNDQGNLYPSSVTVSGDLTDAEIAKMKKMIEEELAVAEQNQHYERIKLHEGEE